MKIENRFFPGALGGIIALHGQHYARHWGFETYFEAKVASELADFALRSTDNDLILLAHDDAGVAASLILDLNDLRSGHRGGHLRWFISADRCRGTGIGRSFLDQAISHAEHHCNGHIWLTTFAGLEPARHLYESFGFSLFSEAEGQAWGIPVMEQEFRR